MIVKKFKDTTISKFKNSRLWINGTMLWGKITGKNYPCGRTKKDKHLCCRRQLTKSNGVFSEDRKTIYCKYCGSIKVTGNKPLRTIDDLWGE